MKNLVNRTDVWGGYLPLHLRKETKSVTKPAKIKRGRVLLRVEHLAQHFRGANPEDVIGLHSTGPDATCRWVP